MKARLLLAALAALAAGCAAASGPYLQRTDEIVQRLAPLGRELPPFAEAIRKAEGLFLDGRDLDARRRDPAAAKASLAGAAAAIREARMRLAVLRAEVYDLGLRVKRLGESEPPPRAQVVHAPTGRTFTYRDYQSRLEALFSALGGVHFQSWKAEDLEEDELPPFTGEESRIFIDESGKDILLERGGEGTPVRLAELEGRGLLRSPFQIGNYLEALDAYLAAFALRAEGKTRVDFYTVSPFRNINKPFWPWMEYDPLVYWAVRVTKNYALAPDRPGGAAYLPALEERLGALSARLKTLAEELEIYRDAFGKARSAAESGVTATY